MDTYRINKPEDLEKHKDEYGFKINGNAVVSCDIELNGRVMVEGSLTISPGWYIKAGRYINAGGFIEAGGFINAGEHIKAGRYIKAGEYIEAGGRIKAGESIKAGRYIFSFDFDLSATHIITKTVPFWRDFWAEMPPLKKWSKDILDDKNCWNDLRNILTKEEAAEVCGWDGWHWILRAQLEMFFGLKDKHIISE